MKQEGRKAGEGFRQKDLGEFGEVPFSDRSFLKM